MDAHFDVDFDTRSEMLKYGKAYEKIQLKTFQLHSKRRISPAYKKTNCRGCKFHLRTHYSRLNA